MKDYYKMIINALIDQATEKQLRMIIWFVRGLLDPQDRKREKK